MVMCCWACQIQAALEININIDSLEAEDTKKDNYSTLMMPRFSNAKQEIHGAGK